MIRPLGRRFVMRPGQHRPRPVRDGLVLLLVLGALLYAGYTRSVPFTGPSGETLTAEIASAANVRSGQPVRVNGVDVGAVTGVELGRTGRSARVTMRIDSDSGIDLRRDARIAVWWRTLLGYNQYVELEPGSPSAPPLQGHVIPVERTSVQTEVDEVLRTLDDTGRTAVQRIVREFDRGFARPATVRAALERGGPATRGLADTVEPLRGTRPGDDLPGLVRGANRLFGAVAADEAALAGLVDHSRTALAVTAARRADLGAAITAAPGAMRETRATLVRVTRTLDLLDPLVRDLEPGARALAPAAQKTGAALREAVPVLERARPLLRSLQPSLRGLAPVSRDSLALISDLDPTIDRTRTEIVPWLERRDDSTKLRNVEAIGPTFSVLADMASQFDANGFWVRFQTAPAERALTTAPCLTHVANPDAKAKLDCAALTKGLETVLGLRPAAGRRTSTGKDRRP